MASPVTLQTLQNRVLQRANLEGATAFIATSELTDCINASIAEWYDIVRLSEWGGQFYRSSVTFPTVGAQSYYTFASIGITDFLSLISVDVAVASNMIIAARPYQEEQRNTFRQYPVGGWLYTRPVFYQLQGEGISFIPTPQSAFSITLNYVATAPVLVAPTDPLNSINGWDEWIVLDAAIKLLVKDGQLDVVPLLMGMRESQKARIVSATGSRDMMAAEMVHDVYAGSFDNSYF